MLTTSSFSRGVSESAQPDTVWHALAQRLLVTAVVDRPAGEDARALLEHIRALPLDSQLLWQDLVRKRFALIRSQARACGHKTELRVRLDDSPSAACGSCGASETGVAGALTHPRLAESERRSLRGLRPGDDCERALREAFQAAAGVATQAVVLDRFAVTDALRGDAAAPGASGLQRFIELCASSGVQDVEIFVSTEGTFNKAKLLPADAAQRLAGLLSTAATGSTGVTLHVVSGPAAQREIHDRWVGLSWSSSGQMTWNLGKGLGQLNGRRARQAHILTRVADDMAATIRSRITKHVVLSTRVV
jgi:hypothetical protein